jgi:tetratricopeptide (TPR) repeat protein
MNNETFDKYAVFLVCGFLAAAIVAVYWQVFDNEFVNYDDTVYITENPDVNCGFTRQAVIRAFTQAHCHMWHPLTTLSHILDCELFGLNPARHHLTSLLLHIANTILLFLVFRRMTGAIWPSAFVAAVFALHPLNVESVAWAAERKNVLSTLFWLLTMWAYISYARAPAISRYLTVLLVFAAGLMAKPMLVTLPLVMLLMDYWPLRRTGRQLIVEKVPFFILAAVLSVITFFAQQKGAVVSALDKLSFASRICNALNSYVVYIIKTFVPTHLAVYYPHPHSFASWQIIGAASVLLGISAAVLAWRRRYLVFGWLWYLITLVPVIGLVQVGSQAGADRYMYIPMIGLSVMIVWSTKEIAAKWRLQKLLPVVAALCLAMLMLRTYQQVRYWKDSLSLFGHALQVTSDNHIANLNFGNALFKQKNFDRAIEHYKKAIEISPGYIDAHSNLGVALFQAGRLDEAIEQFKAVLRLQQDNPKAYFYIAGALLKQGKIDEAVGCYEKALALNPDSVESHFNLARALNIQQRSAQAAEHYQQVLKLDPNNAAACVELGTTLISLKRPDEAIRCYEKAIEIEPQNVIAHGQLALALAGQGKITEAIQQCRLVLESRPDDAEMHFNLGFLLEKQGKTSEAIAQYHQALQLDPNFTKAAEQIKAATSPRP